MGREISGDFARRSFRVVIASCKAAAREELARELRERYAADAVGLSCHVGHWAECGSLIGRTLDEFGASG